MVLNLKNNGLFTVLRIPDPDFYPFRIPDPKTATKIYCYFFCSHKFHKIENYLIFSMLKRKIWASFQRILELYTQKFFTKLKKIMGLGSEIRDPERNLFRIPDPGPGSKRHRIPNPDPQHWLFIIIISASRINPAQIQTRALVLTKVWSKLEFKNFFSKTPYVASYAYT
jgi:hypothetical protein